MQRDTVADNTDNDALDDECLVREIHLYRFELRILG
jgi:hypothetical protein